MNNAIDEAVERRLEKQDAAYASGHPSSTVFQDVPGWETVYRDGPGFGW
jgi:hypothetical protein